MSTEADPFKKPPRRPYEPKDEDSPYWGRVTLLSRVSNWGTRSKLLWVGWLFTGFGCIALLGGVLFYKILGIGVGSLVVAYSLPSDE